LSGKTGGVPEEALDESVLELALHGGDGGADELVLFGDCLLLSLCHDTEGG